MRSLLLSIVRANRRASAARFIANACSKYLRAYWNENNWNMDRNGEGRVLEIFAGSSGGEQMIMFDVGAFRGEWSIRAAKLITNSKIFAFEIVPAVYQELRSEIALYPNVSVFPFGLSNIEATLSVTHNKSHPSTSSIVPNCDSDFFARSEIVLTPCQVRRGDDVVNELGLAKIDFLKIDTEGHEISVLEGFSSALASSCPPRLIQFEYGGTFFNASRKLKDAYDILSPFGYVIGRIFPSYVDFKSYERVDEHFRMGNYLAIKTGDPILRQLADSY